MLELAAIGFTAAVAAATTWGVLRLSRLTKQPQRAKWDEVGGIGLLAGLVMGFGAGELLGGVEGWEWGMAVMPGLFLGLFLGMLPSARTASLQALGWASFALGGISGLVLGLVLGGF